MIHKQIVIIGGGPVGLSAAIFLMHHGLSVTILDSGKPKNSDARILALSHASIELLEEYNICVNDHATSINKVHISHKGLGVSEIKASELDLANLGYTVKYADLCAVLENIVFPSPSCERIVANVDRVMPGDDYATITYSNNSEVNCLIADIVILAEGGNLEINDASYKFHDYGQNAIIARIKAQLKPKGTAYERFGNEGGLVLLPYGDEYVLVWSLDNDLIQHAGLNKNTLQEKLQSIPFMDRFGHFMVDGDIHQFPLQLRYTQKRVLKNVILIGNSAQTIHPVSAQGLNLGLRDAKVLCDLIIKNSTYQNGELDNIAINGLKSYDALRNFDTKMVLNFTHYLAKFVEIDLPVINHLRGLGIAMLSNLKPLQDKIANSLIFGN